MTSIRILMLGTAISLAALPAFAIPAKSLPFADDASYQLTDGRRVDVVRDGETLRLRIGKHGRDRWLLHDGSGRFVSRDGALVATFSSADDGADGEKITLSMAAPASTR